MDLKSEKKVISRLAVMNVLPSLIFFLLFSIVGKAHMYFNSHESGCDGSDPNILFCDDFEDGSWAYTNCNDGPLGTQTGPGYGPNNQNNDGWCINVYGDAPPADAPHLARCAARGVAGTNCTAVTGPHTGVGQAPGMGDHDLNGATTQSNGFNEIYARYYRKNLPGYDTGQEKILTFNHCCAGYGGIHFALLWTWPNGAHMTPQLMGEAEANVVIDANRGMNIASIDMVPDHWYAIENHIKLNTPGVYNGVWEMWIDDCNTNGLGCTGQPTLRAQWSNILFRASGDNSNIGTLWFENWANPASSGESYYDQIKVSKVRVGWMTAGNHIPDTTPPSISNPQPTGALPSGTTSTTMSVTTNENANCKYSTTANVAYSSMTNTFSTTGGTSHSILLTGLANGQTYTRHVRCQDAAGNANTNDFIISFSVSISGNTYYVDGANAAASDGNPGGQSSPWKTIAKAANVMVGGDTAIVLPGTYRETITSVRSGVSGGRIIFRNSGGTATVNGVVVAHSYITIDGFSIEQGGITINAGSYIELVNNMLTNGVIYTPSTYTGTNMVISGNHITSNQNWGDDWPAIMFFGTNHLIEKNEIGPSIDTDAFRPFGTGHIIRNNYIHDLTYSPGTQAHSDIFQVYGLNNYQAYNIVFEGNLIVNSQGQMFMTENNGNANVRDFDVRNNIWVNVWMQGNIGIPGFRFYNNVVYGGGNTNAMALYVYYDPGKGETSNLKIENNIFIGTGADNTNIGGSYNIQPGTSTVGRVVDYNFIARSAASKYSPVSGFTEPHGMNGGDPKFVNAAGNDFRLQSDSPAIDHGTALSGFSYDYVNTARPQGIAWDIGAYEFSGTSPSFDFSLSNGASKTITQGQSTTNTITSILLSGTTQSVSFSATGLPTGATASYSPTSCSPTCATTITINTLSTTPTGTYAINVNGVGGGVTKTTSFSLTVNSASTNTITIGETNILTSGDNANANLLLAQQATLSQTATIQSLSFYVMTASGKLRLGIYDATGPNGGPGAKKAETNEIIPIVGWNTAPVITPVLLPAGTYWLAYLPNDNNLAFVKGDGPTSYYYNYNYGTMPTTFSTALSSTQSHWSLYATLNTGTNTNSCSWDFFPRDIPDGKVTLGDVLVVVGDFGKTSTSPGFNPKMDFNNNNQIDLFDVLSVVAHFGNCL